MRKLVPILLIALALPAAALARPDEKGDGTLAIKNGSATVQIVAKGSILGRIGSGSLVITDWNPIDGASPQVFGADKTTVKTDLTTVYRGEGMRFRFVGGRYTIRVVGTGIDIAAVGTGIVRVTGEGTLDDGLYSLDGTAFKRISSLLTVGGFGQQPTTTVTAPVPSFG